MAKEISIGELKEKFNAVQNIHQELKEEKIRLESEINTLQKDYDEKAKELLEKTGTASVEEASAYCDKMKKELTEEMESLSVELNKYLDTYGESSSSEV